MQGLRDQQEALRWLHHNIHSFGGDPDRVLIYGQSAGGASVAVQLVAEGSAGTLASLHSNNGSLLHITSTMWPTQGYHPQHGVCVL